ncbi:Uncharacterised protein [Bordetella pertussis]|nr:Uncharacterised protein [Bordetella pertussis]
MARPSETVPLAQSTVIWWKKAAPMRARSNSTPAYQSPLSTIPSYRSWVMASASACSVASMGAIREGR